MNLLKTCDCCEFHVSMDDYIACLYWFCTLIPKPTKKGQDTVENNMNL
jgi:hypothetical protein